MKPGSALHVPVSVIVCAHDEEQNLRELIPQLLNQKHPEFELIIVNDRSNDGTYDFLLEETKKHARLKMVNVAFKPDHINGKKFALTLGIKAAQYDWVLLTDADCRPVGNEWLHQMAGSFNESNSMVLGYSPYQPKPGFLNSFVRFETILTAIQYFSFALLGSPYMGVGRNLAYRKNIFLENKGFNNHISVTGGDDDLFVNQHAVGNKTAVQLSAATIMVSQPKETWTAFWQQKIRHLAVGKFYSTKSKLMLAPFTLSWTLFWPVAFGAMVFQFPLVAIAIFVRWVAQMVVVFRFTAKTGERLESWKLPFLDFTFGFYYLVAGFKALITKRVKWKT
jgi:glycosyltransferase involved in cell wall biosynthesis